MKTVLNTGLLLLASLFVQAASAKAADYPKHWVATNDPAHWRINQSSRTLDGKPIWVATDDNRGGYEELVEISRDEATVTLRSLKTGIQGFLTHRIYRSYKNGRLVFERTGDWID